MYFNFGCPHCGKNLRVKEELAGRNARCPYCKHQVKVPQPAPPEPDPLAPPDLASLDLGALGGPPGFDPLAPKAAAVASPTAPGPSPGSAGAKPMVAVASGGRGKAAKSQPATTSNDDGTNVSLIWTAAFGLLFTVSFYAVLAPTPPTYFRDLFFNRGWVTIAETFLMYWAIAILIAKTRKLYKQRESMLFDLLPESIGKEISRANVAQFSSNVRGLPVDVGSSFLTRRVLRGLEHYSVRGSSGEVSSMLSSQAELDNNAVASSYSLLNVFIWAIPILGFIGTVQGLGDAVGNLSGSLESASDVESVKKSLGAITGGLGVAFDTTLVALIMSLFLKFPASSLQKSEEDLLNWVEDYCNENLLKRLVDEDSGSPMQGDAAGLNRAIIAALAPHQAELRAWTARLREIGKELTDEVSRGWTAIAQQAQSEHAQRLAEVTSAATALGETTSQLGQVAAQFGGVAQKLSESQEAQIAWGSRVAEQQAAQLGDSQQAVATAVQQSTATLQEQMDLLQQAVLNLNDALGQLNGKQVVIQVEQPKRRGWFG